MVLLRWKPITSCFFLQYENGARVFSEGLDKLKDMILVTNLAKATERAVNLSSQAFTSVDAGAEAKTGAKRKRVLAGK